MDYRPLCCVWYLTLCSVIIYSHIHLIHSMEELDNLPSPKVRDNYASWPSLELMGLNLMLVSLKVVLATSSSLECGFSKELFIRWAPDPRNSIILTTTSSPNSFATRVAQLAKSRSGDRTISCMVRWFISCCRMQSLSCPTP